MPTLRMLLGGWALAPATTGPAGTYVVVDTGQTACYDNAREIAAPKPGEAFHGQDAQ